MSNLLIRSSKLKLNNPLVRISTICYVLGTNDIQIVPLSIFSFMKCLSILTCLVQSYCIRFCAMLMAALLSQYNFIGMLIGIFNSFNTLFSHNISQTLWVISLIFCFDTTCYHILFLTSPHDQVSPNICAIPLM